jgi:hypothetical protein
MLIPRLLSLYWVIEGLLNTEPKFSRNPLPISFPYKITPYSLIPVPALTSHNPIFFSIK